jgi:hypothetical protein
MKRGDGLFHFLCGEARIKEELVMSENSDECLPEPTGTEDERAASADRGEASGLPLPRSESPAAALTRRASSSPEKVPYLEK